MSALRRGDDKAEGHARPGERRILSRLFRMAKMQRQPIAAAGSAQAAKTEAQIDGIIIPFTSCAKELFPYMEVPGRYTAVEISFDGGEDLMFYPLRKGGNR